MDERDRSAVESGRNQGVDIYDDDVAVAVVGGLFDDDPESAGKVKDTSRDVKESTGPRGGREYKVREYFSDRDDLTAEEEPPARAATPAAAVRGDSAGRPSRAELNPERRVPPARPEQKSDEVDYSDYIHSTSMELASERKRKELEPPRGHQKDHKEYIRDASRNPAVRRERDGATGREAPRTDVPRADARVPARHPATVGRVPRTPVPVRGRARDPYNPNPSIPHPSVQRDSAQKDDESRDSVSPRDEGARTAGKYPAQTPAKPPLRSTAARRSEFFEQDGKREREFDDGPDILSSPFVRYAIIGGFVLLLAGLIFLIFQNRALNQRIAEADSIPLSEDRIYASAEYTSLKIQSDNKDARISELEKEVEELKNPTTINNPADGTLPGDAITDGSAAQPPNSVTNPFPTPPPQAPLDREYEVKSGDTMTKIARELLGSDARWKEIQELNGMTTEQAGNLTPGQTIKIPQE